MRSLVLTLVLLFLVVDVNAAPQIGLMGGLPDSYERARAVFIGVVVKYRPSASTVKTEQSFDKVTFRVEYSWKGAGFREFGLSELVVLVEREPEFEGMEPYIIRRPTFREGRKYLVFADESWDKKRLVIGPANRSKPFWEATEDVMYLKRLTAPFPFPSRASAHF